MYAVSENVLHAMCTCVCLCTQSMCAQKSMCGNECVCVCVCTLLEEADPVLAPFPQALALAAGAAADGGVLQEDTPLRSNPDPAGQILLLLGKRTLPLLTL